MTFALERNVFHRVNRRKGAALDNNPAIETPSRRRSGRRPNGGPGLRSTMVFRRGGYPLIVRSEHLHRCTGVLTAPLFRTPASAQTAPGAADPPTSRTAAT